MDCDSLRVLPQYLLPQHALSRLVGRLTRLECPGLTPFLIRAFCRHFAVDLNEAERASAEDYRSFNDFFTRALKPGARPLPDPPQTLISPVDGRVSQAGPVTSDALYQAKGRNFSLSALLGGDDALAAKFMGGRYATLYLAPRNYHRIHAPCDFTLETVHYVRGRLFSVNEVTTRTVDGLFARNERVVLSGRAAWGPMALVLVGAMLVGSMEVVGVDLRPLMTGGAGSGRRRLEVPIAFRRGQETGRFNMGSTVILVLPAEGPEWSAPPQAGAAVRMGQAL